MIRRVRTPVILVGAGVAWLATKERNPVRWPAYVRDQALSVVRDVREAAVDGARAGLRAEKAFDDDLAGARRGARTWE